MRFLLDTNVWVALLRGRDAGVRNRIAAVAPADVAACAIVRAELYVGAQRSSEPVKNLLLVEALLSAHLSLPFDDGAAREYGRIRAQLEGMGLPIGGNDYMIAAIALANDVTLVTHNTGEFSRVPGLMLVDWHVP